jgi:spore germination protein YaaH
MPLRQLLLQSNKKLGIALALFVSASAFALPSYALSTASSTTFTKIFYYKDSENARQSLYNNYKSIDVLAPQMYGINENGDIENDLQHGEIINFAEGNGIKVMPLVTNKGFAKASLAILDNPSMQDRVASELVDEAKKMGYIGYELDFEQMDASYKDKYTSFVSDLHNALNQAGLSLSVAVVSKISDNPTDYKNDLWQKLIGAYDYSALGAASDFVTVMSYDDPDSKGPIARRDWLLKVIAYSALHIPKEKISLGIGLYYWDWNNVTKKLISIGGYEGMQNVMKKYNPKYAYSSVEHAPYITYGKKGVGYTMWYENGKSISDKISLAQKSGFRGVSMWSLGLEVPSVWKEV